MTRMLVILCANNVTEEMHTRIGSRLDQTFFVLKSSFLCLMMLYLLLTSPELK